MESMQGQVHTIIKAQRGTDHYKKNVLFIKQKGKELWVIVESSWDNESAGLALAQTSGVHASDVAWISEYLSI